MRRLVPIVIAVLLFSACKLKVEQGFELNADGSGQAVVITGFDEELLGFFEQSAPGEDPFGAQDLPPGWVSEDWSEGVFTGFKASAPFANTSGLEALIEETMTGEDGFFEEASIVETGDGFRFEGTLSGESFDQLEQQGFDSGDIEDQIEGATSLLFDLSVAIKLPGEVLSHNADQVRDGWLVWDLALTDAGRVLSAESGAGAGLPLVPLAAAVVLVALLGGGFLAWKRRAGSSTTSTLPATLVEEPVAVSEASYDGDPFA